MSDTKRKYDSTIARMAGNIAAGLVREGMGDEKIVHMSVRLARAIVEETIRTEPAPADQSKAGREGTPGA